MNRSIVLRGYIGQLVELLSLSPVYRPVHLKSQIHGAVWRYENICKQHWSANYQHSTFLNLCNSWHNQTTAPRFYATTANEKPNHLNANDDDDEKELTLYQRFKKTYKKYGKVLVGVHLVTSCAWLGTFYYCAKSGLDVVGTLETRGVSEKILSPLRKPGVGDLAVAYLCYKIVTPLRYMITIGGTHVTVRYLRHLGVMQQVPEGERIRDLVKDGYDDFRDEVKGKVHNSRDEFLEMVKDRKAALRNRVQAKKNEISSDVTKLKHNFVSKESRKELRRKLFSKKK